MTRWPLCIGTEADKEAPASRPAEPSAAAAAWLLSHTALASPALQHATYIPPPVAMVIETGVSSGEPTTDIREPLKQKHQTAAGGGDLLSPRSKSI